MPRKSRSVTKARTAREKAALQEGLVAIGGYALKRQREALRAAMPKEKPFILADLSMEERRALRLAGEDKRQEAMNEVLVAIEEWPEMRKRLNIPIKESSDVIKPEPIEKAQWLDLSPKERAEVQMALDEIDDISEKDFRFPTDGSRAVEFEKNPEAAARLWGVHAQIDALTKKRETIDEAQISAAFQAEKDLPPVRGFGSSFRPAIANKLRVASADGGYAVTVDMEDSPIIMDGRLKQDGTWTLRGSAPVDPVTRDETAAKQEPWTVQDIAWMQKKYGSMVAKVRVGGLYNYLSREAVVSPLDLIDKKTGAVLPTPLIGYRRAYVLEVPLSDPKTGLPLTKDDLGRFGIARNLRSIAAQAAKKAVPEFLHLISIRGTDEREQARRFMAEPAVRQALAALQPREPTMPRQALPEPVAPVLPPVPALSAVVPTIHRVERQTVAQLEARKAVLESLLATTASEKRKAGYQAEIADAEANIKLEKDIQRSAEVRNAPLLRGPAPLAEGGPVIRTEVWKIESAIAAAEGLLARASRKPLLEQTPEDGRVIRETASIIDGLKKKLRAERKKNV